MANSADAPRDLLFGLLALQNGLIDQEGLIGAFRAWTRDRGRSLADHLIDRGALEADQRAALEALADGHLKKHDGDAERGLASIAAGRSTLERLAALGDPDLEATIDHVGSAATLDDPDRTATHDVGTVTAAGHRFRILRPHARGGLGAVFVALDSELNREVAVKTIQDRFADEPTSRGRFLLEAEITGGLEHPGIVPVYGLGHGPDGRPYYAMRFIKGDSLKDAIIRFHADPALKADPGARSLALQKLLRRFLDVCDAIEYAHRRGVLHRDLKPGNIMVGKYGETLVVDWGLAKPSGVEAEADPERGGERPLVPASSSGSSETLPGSAIGTPGYMSPEQAAGELDRLGPASDVYSLGATLYALLTGRPPIEGSDVRAMLRRVQRGEFPPPQQLEPTIDRPLEAVCLKAMALRPEDRYASPRALAEDLEHWMADEPVTARREPLAARLGRWARRHRAAVAALGLSMATAIVLLSVATLLINKARDATQQALVRVSQEQRKTAAALEQADANFRQARQAVEDYFTIVSEEVLLDQPGLQPLRERLLRAALDYHEAFLEEHADDPSLEAELAGSHARYAYIADRMGGRADGLSHVHEALTLARGLVERAPEPLEHRRLLADCLYNLGQFLESAENQYDETIRAYREAIALYEDLLREQPGNAEIRMNLARALANLGTSLHDRQDSLEEAESVLQRAREILARLIEEHPESLQYQLALANLQDRLFNFYAGGPEWQEEALRASEAAIDLYKRLIAEAPNSPRFQFNLGSTYHTRGVLFLRAGRYSDAIRELGQDARPLLAELIRANPGIEEYSLLLARIDMIFGTCLFLGPDEERAIEVLQESRAGFENYLQNNPDHLGAESEYLSVLNSLGATLSFLDRDAEAAEILSVMHEQNEALCRRDPENLFKRGHLVIGAGNLGLSLLYTRRYEEAEHVFSQALDEIDTHFNGNMRFSPMRMPVFWIGKAYALRELGRSEEAKRSLDSARAFGVNDSLSKTLLARYEARGAQLAAREGDTARREALERRAVEALVAAIRSGATGLESMLDDEEFLPLYDRRDFQLLLRDAAFPPDPFARPD